MANGNTYDGHTALRQYKVESGLMKRVDCTESENQHYNESLKAGQALPLGIFQYQTRSGFYKMASADLSESEIAEYLTYKQLNLLTSIKNCLIFFVVLAAIAVLVAIIGAF